ncbi:hypothetical protein GCM10009654_20150 [Streptomyces hebeiensis]|uniref:Uncharacterized protein n=1 Tax=Streptomyces hebeiensis TaxID=229486 RepID=A0ABN1UTH7_9ACTN
MTADPVPHTVRARVTSCLLRGHDHRGEFAPASGLDLPSHLVVYTDAPPPAVGSQVHLRARGPAHPPAGLPDAVMDWVTPRAEDRPWGRRW